MLNGKTPLALVLACGALMNLSTAHANEEISELDVAALQDAAADLTEVAAVDEEADAAMNFEAMNRRPGQPIVRDHRGGGRPGGHQPAPIVRDHRRPQPGNGGWRPTPQPRPRPIVRPGNPYPRPGHGGGYYPAPRPRPVVHPRNHRHVRYNPYPIHRGACPWPTWHHGRSYVTYRFDWPRVRNVTCTAADSWGNQYPVTETEYWGYNYQTYMPQIQDAALNRCYSESGGDPSCYVIGCIARY